VSATVPNTKVCGPPPKQKAIYATGSNNLGQDEGDENYLDAGAGESNVSA
jgi:hypothetical protein